MPPRLKTYFYVLFELIGPGLSPFAADDHIVPSAPFRSQPAAADACLSTRRCQTVSWHKAEVLKSIQACIMHAEEKNRPSLPAVTDASHAEAVLLTSMYCERMYKENGAKNGCLKATESNNT